jgi:integrase
MTAQIAKEFQLGKETWSLPETARTRSGVEFDPRSNKWVWRESTLAVSFNFLLITNLSPALLPGFKRCMLWYVENTSPSHARELFSRFRSFAKFLENKTELPLTQINSAQILSYRSSLSENTRWYLASLSGMLKKWSDLAPGISKDAIALLRQLRLPGNKKGEAVLTMDPDTGPYTDIEWQSIQVALKASYELSSISRSDYLLVNLFMLLGVRPVQIAELNVDDIHEILTSNGAKSYLLKIPRAKQRNTARRFQMKDRLITPSIGQLLLEHANEVRKKHAGSALDSVEIPMFTTVSNPNSTPLEHKFRCTSGSISGFFERAVLGLRVRSERTGEKIRVTATRFRRTIGTRAAAEGHGELIIAELLDHTDTQNVGVYVQSSPAIVERIDRAVAMRMAPLAQAFSGTLIRNESEASRKNDPSSRICDPRIEPSLKPMGNCGKYGYCGLLAPIACYTCANFQPWIDGPHLKVLDFLIQERDRLLETTDHRIASLNDRTILAAAEVARQCAAIQNPSEENPSV